MIPFYLLIQHLLSTHHIACGIETKSEHGDFLLAQIHTHTIKLRHCKARMIRSHQQKENEKFKLANLNILCIRTIVVGPKCQPI